MDKWLKTGSFKTSATSSNIQLGESVVSTSGNSDESNLEPVAGTSSEPDTRPSTSEEDGKKTLNKNKRYQNINASSAKKRKYSDEYLKYGFSFTVDDDCQKPLCVVCGEILSNGSMKPSLLIRHLNTKHPNCKQKDISYFQRLSTGPDVPSLFSSANKDNENAVEASYRISYRIAKNGKNHTVAENLISGCIKDAVKCMLGEEYVGKIDKIPLSNNTVSRRIRDMSDDIETSVAQKIKKSPFFSIQVDESTDVASLSVLLVIARYLNENVPEENLLLCYPLTERCTGEDIFHVIQGYFIEHEISWENCCGVCADGGKSMSGCYKGLKGRIKEVAPHISWSHCAIHRQSLASKPLPNKLKEVLNDSVKVVNFIKGSATKARLFKLLCEDMDSLHVTLLYHTEVRWLSRGKVLTRLFELRNEALVFFEDNPFQLAHKFYDSKWLQQLAYLADIFSEINKLNLELQKSSVNIFKLSDKIESMVKKLAFWKSCISKGQCEVFATLSDFLNENHLKLSEEVKVDIESHLEGLQLSFRKYFPEPVCENNWISNPFDHSFFDQATSLPILDKEALIEISTDSSLRSQFKREDLTEFWANIRQEYESVSNKALKHLIPFTSSVLVERAFSSYAFIKNKQRNKLDAAPDLRVYLSSFDPDFKKLSTALQAQGSH